ncbi:hypothetical protein [Novipirellula artificiosorum]|nr:hypothetical protein [Novipirellula artificiosorum]
MPDRTASRESTVEFFTPTALHSTAQGRDAVKPQSAPWVTARVTPQTLKGFYKRTHRRLIIASVGIRLFVERLRRTTTLVGTQTQGAPLRVDPGLRNRTASR